MAGSRNALAATMAIPGAFHHRLYNDGIEGHLLCIFPIVIKGQMPDAGIQILDKTRFVETDRPRLPTRSLRLEQVALLPCDQPAAVQELHEVILSM